MTLGGRRWPRTSASPGAPGSCLAVLGGAIAVFLLLYLLFSGRSVETNLDSRLSAYSAQEEPTGWMGRIGCSAGSPSPPSGWRNDVDS